MITVFRKSDRIPVKVGPMELLIGPMSVLQKQKIYNCVTQVSGETKTDELEMARLAFKYSIKEIKGLCDMSGKPYICEFDDNGDLTDDCSEELMGIDQSAKLIRLLSGFLTGIKDPKIEGVEVKIPKLKNAKRRT